MDPRHLVELVQVVGWTLVGAVGFLAVPTAAYLVASQRGQGTWLPKPGSPVRTGQGTYRSAVVEGLAEPGKAPGTARFAAFVCFVMGQMALPGLAAGLLGLFAGGIGLVSIPGLWLAGRIFWLGFQLLERRPGVAEAARSVARQAVWLNVIEYALCAIVAIVGTTARWHIAGLFVGLLVFGTFYAPVSLLHAYLLRRAADELDAYGLEEASPSPLAATPHPHGA